MNVGDCFVVKGSFIEDPFTMYYITEICEGKINALSIYVGNDKVLGFDVDEECDEDVIKEAVLLPNNTYSLIKQLKQEFLTNIHQFLDNSVIMGEFEPTVGCHYYRHGTDISTVTEIDESMVCSNVFQLQGWVISPYWSGEGKLYSITDYSLPILDEAYKEVFKRYNTLLSDIRRIITQNESQTHSGTSSWRKVLTKIVNGLRKRKQA